MDLTSAGGTIETEKISAEWNVDIDANKDINTGLIDSESGDVNLESLTGNINLGTINAETGIVSLNADNNRQKNKIIGAAAGATCGKIMGMENASKTVLGHAAEKTGDLIVAAMAVINAFGDIKNPATGKIVAGAKDQNGNFVDSEKIVLNKEGINLGFIRENTSLVVLATNAVLSKAEANRVAMMAHSGLSRTIYPVHTLLDGDSIFCLAANRVRADINQIGTMAAEVIKNAVLNSAGIS